MKIKIDWDYESDGSELIFDLNDNKKMNNSGTTMCLILIIKEIVGERFGEVVELFLWNWELMR